MENNMMIALHQLRIILVNPSHPGNIGAVARAMKTMGLKELILVKPLQFPHQEATVRAAGADDILANARIVDSLETAIADCHCVYATSARTRHLAWPTLNVRRGAEQIMATAGDQKIAVVFGRENNGLNNDELMLCHYHLYIPTEPSFGSLNLAAAVQIVCYELRLAALAVFSQQSSNEQEPSRELANRTEMLGFYDHLRVTLIDLGVLQPRQPKLLIRRLHRLFNRAQMDKTEVNILRGLFSAIQKKNN